MPRQIVQLYPRSDLALRGRPYMSAGIEDRLRDRAYQFAHFAEGLLYIVLALLLAVGGVVALAGAGGALFNGLRNGTVNRRSISLRNSARCAARTL